MGWRKLTVRDGDLARCSDLSATEQARRTPIWGFSTAAASQRGLSDSRTAGSVVPGRVAARLRTHHLRVRPRGLFRCGSIILSSQTADKSRRLGRLSHRQSAPRMWSSTLQRSVRLGCRTALSKLRGMASRLVSGRPTVARCPPAGDRACRRLCYCHFN